MQYPSDTASLLSQNCWLHILVKHKINLSVSLWTLFHIRCVQRLLQAPWLQRLNQSTSEQQVQSSGCHQLCSGMLISSMYWKFNFHSSNYQFRMQSYCNLLFFHRTQFEKEILETKRSTLFNTGIVTEMTIPVLIVLFSALLVRSYFQLLYENKTEIWLTLNHVTQQLVSDLLWSLKCYISDFRLLWEHTTKMW